ncbi:MAG: GMC family oxidoreductase [Desulfobacterales bacterium]
MAEWKNINFDAIIIGSGPGGATVANELSKSGKKVLILERGHGRPLNGTLLQGFTMGMIPGRNLLFTQQLLSIIRGITVGGSSILYYACAFDPPFEMFDSYGINIRNEVEELKQELPIAPLSDDLIGPAANKIMQSAKDLGYDWQKIPKLVYQDKCRPDCDKCIIGCPYGAKWTARMYIEEACTRGAILLSNANAKIIITEKGVAKGVTFSIKGRKHKVFSPLIVLAAGGIGTPALLRSAGIKNAGYDFFFDPLITVMGSVKDVKGGKEFPMATGLLDEDEGYVMTDLVWPRFLYWLFTSQVFRLDRLFVHKQTLPIMIKVKDKLGGYLTPRGGVRKRLSDSDREKLNRGYKIAKKILQNAGARNIYKTWYFAAHPGGTSKINEVVDKNLKTEIDNLYVCDCSVIPESWGLPPALTLLSLGKRLVKHLTK